MKLQEYIDHTLLKPQATKEQISQLCEEALKYHFKAVCIHQNYIDQAQAILRNSQVLICTVIGFPLGQCSTQVKLLECQESITMGAQEIDMVINISDVVNANWNKVEREVSLILELCQKNKACLKVIIETCYLTKQEKIKMCEILCKLGVNYIKTSTGFGTQGATLEDIDLFKNELNDSVKIKASGGIKNLKTCLEMIKAGAHRIGTSSGVQIMQEDMDIDIKN